MPGFVPQSLAENAGLAFPGEPAWKPAAIAAKEVERLLDSVNPSGRPNSDVLRRRLAVARGAPRRSWQIDFPPHFTEQEASLYVEPFARVRRDSGTWKNPHAQPALRRALARLTRFLALPATAEASDWHWIEDDVIPDASLFIVAREDDFTHGLLQSPAFAAWYDQLRRSVSVSAIVESFPFPWPPATLLGSLTAAQEEQRHALARAARDGDPEALRTTAFAAYGWPSDLRDEEILERLQALNRSRRSPM